MPANLTAPIMGPFRTGLRNDGVRVVQERLNEVARAGAPRLVPDGAFGQKTDAAVRDFQKAMGLKADGVVGPLTAKALGFSHYMSLQRMGQGAMQLASVITGSLARMIPAPHVQPDPDYNALVALAVHADVLHRVLGALGTIPGATGVLQDVNQVVGQLQTQLAIAKALHLGNRSLAQVKAQQESLHGQLLALSRKLQSLAAPKQATLSAAEKSMLQLLVMQTQMLAMHGQIMRAVLAAQPHADPADEYLKIAANVLTSAKRLLPTF
jgi:peptidoglycan hydrolase-like protein with peptidoglycan-binding domain